jgi:cytochrome oxidase Cu insertion factor (SCO1/SenC/PrrC family)
MISIRKWLFVGLVLLLSLIAACSSESQCDCSQVNNAQLEVGDEAPNFRLQDHTGRYVRLSDYKDKSNVVVAFYPAAFTPV